MVHLAQSSISVLNASPAKFGFVIRATPETVRCQIAALNEADPTRLNGNPPLPTVACGRPG
jgi:hypothetical protein